MRQRQKELHEERLNQLATNLEEHSDSYKVWEWTRYMTKTKLNRLILKTEDDKEIKMDEEKAEILTQHYSKSFVAEGVQPVLPIMESGLLFRRKIEVQEVEDAMATLRNKRAVGPDGIPGELIKYGGQIMAQHLDLLYNHIMEHDQSVQELKMGTLYILNKKGKGSLPEDTRPLVFLSAMRKVLSRVTLNRLLPGVNTFISPAQHAYRAG